MHGDVFEQLRIFLFVFDCWFRCLFICSYFNENSLYVFVMTSLRTTVIIWPKLTGEREYGHVRIHTYLPTNDHYMQCIVISQYFVIQVIAGILHLSLRSLPHSKCVSACVCPTNNHIFILHSLEFHIQIPQQLAPNWKKPQFEHSNKLCADQSSQ